MKQRYPTRVMTPAPRTEGAKLKARPLRSGSEVPLREKWEQFAQSNPYKYILTTGRLVEGGEFWKTGEHAVETEILPLLRQYNVQRYIGLDLGCGIGRLAVPLASHFQHLVGVDISPSMIQRATSIARDKCINNISYYAVSGPEDFLHQCGGLSGSCDFVYSILVFQHIPDFSMIEGYLHVIRVLLRESGLAYLQFDTRFSSLAYRLKTRLPDFLLPRFWRRGIRRIRRVPDEVERAVKSAHLEIIARQNPRSANDCFLLRISGGQSETK